LLDCHAIGRNGSEGHVSDLLLDEKNLSTTGFMLELEKGAAVDSFHFQWKKPFCLDRDVKQLFLDDEL
jgi:hypothetical protein